MNIYHGKLEDPMIILVLSTVLQAYRKKKRQLTEYKCETELHVYICGLCVSAHAFIHILKSVD